MLKLNNGAARRAKPLVKTCLAIHAGEIGEKAWPGNKWRSSERLGKPITLSSQLQRGLHWQTDRTGEPDSPGRLGRLILSTRPLAQIGPDDPTR